MARGTPKHGRHTLLHLHHQRGHSDLRHCRVLDELHRFEARLQNVEAHPALSTLWRDVQGTLDTSTDAGAGTADISLDVIYRGDLHGPDARL